MDPDPLPPSGVIASIITISAASPIEAHICGLSNSVPIVLSFAMIGLLARQRDLRCIHHARLRFRRFYLYALRISRIAFPLAIVLGPLMETS